MTSSRGSTSSPGNPTGEGEGWLQPDVDNGTDIQAWAWSTQGQVTQREPNQDASLP